MVKEYKTKRKNNPDYIAAAATEIGNKPPQAPEVEDAVLGAMMMEENCVDAAMESLDEKSFYNPRHRLVFRAIKELTNKRMSVDIATVAEQLREDGVLDDIGGTAALADLTTKVGSAANFEYHVKILQQKTIQRNIIEVGYKMLKNAFDETYNVDKLVSETHQDVYNAIEGSRRSGYEDLGTAIAEAIERIERSQSATGLTGIASGFPSLDAITMGWQPGNLIVIGARPGHGKTAIALNMARAAAVDFGIPTAFFTLEMTYVELADRLIGTETGLSSAFRKGRKKMTEADWNHLEKAINKAARAPLYLDETPALTISECVAKLKRMKNERNIKIAFVDYLQLMHGSDSNSQYRAQEIGEISRQLKETAKELKIPIIALAQLNRNIMVRAGSINGRPLLSDLKDSGSIEQDADIVLFIHRPSLLGLSEQPDTYAELIIAKNRAGEMGVIPLSFNGDLVKFTEATESLSDYADKLDSKKAQQKTGATSWDQFNGAVGQYDPFAPDGMGYDGAF